MPRFCSSNTRPNSLPSGGRISLATMLKPERQALPGAERPGEHFQASGSCMANAFSRRLRRKRIQTAGSVPSRAQGGQQAPGGCTRNPTAPPAAARTAEISHELAGVKDASACSNSRFKLPKRSRNVSSSCRAWSSGWASTLACFRASLAGRRAVPVSSQAVFERLAGSCGKKQNRRRPPSRRRPINMTMAISSGLSQSSIITRWRKALEGSRTPAASRRLMNAGRTPVATNLP